MAIIAERYVQALHASSRDNDESVMFQKGLKEISELFKGNREFKNILLNPCITNNEKIEVIKGLFPKYCENITFLNFLTEVLNKERITLINNISEEYTKVNSSINKELDLTIVVATEPNENQIKDIVNKYKEIYKANTVNYTIKVDKSIIGGVKVLVGNTVYDSTIETQLKQIF